MRILSFLSIFGLILSESEEEGGRTEASPLEEEPSSCGCGKALNRNLIEVSSERENEEKKSNDANSECQNPERLLSIDANEERVAFVEGGEFYMGTSKPMIRLVLPPFPFPLMRHRMENRHIVWFN
jgi:hypothetical protein